MSKEAAVAEPWEAFTREERQAYEADKGQCHRGCGYELAAHKQPRDVDDDCPTAEEAEAVARAT